MNLTYVGKISITEKEEIYYHEWSKKSLLNDSN